MKRHRGSLVHSFEHSFTQPGDPPPPQIQEERYIPRGRCWEWPPGRNRPRRPPHKRAGGAQHPWRRTWRRWTPCRRTLKEIGTGCVRWPGRACLGPPSDWWRWSCLCSRSSPWGAGRRWTSVLKMSRRSWTFLRWWAALTSACLAPLSGGFLAVSLARRTNRTRTTSFCSHFLEGLSAWGALWSGSRSGAGTRPRASDVHSGMRDWPSLRDNQPNSPKSVFPKLTSRRFSV